MNHKLNSVKYIFYPSFRPGSCPEGIQNLVSGYILGWRSVTYHFWVTVTLTSDLIYRIRIGSSVYLLHSLMSKFKFGV